MPLGSGNIHGARCSLRVPAGEYSVFSTFKLHILISICKNFVASQALTTYTDYSTDTILLEHSLTKVELNKPYL